MFHIIKLCLPRSTLQVTTHATKPDAHVCLRNTSQAGGLTGGAVFPTIVAEHPSAVLVHFGGSRTSRTRDIDGNFSKSVLRWLSLYPAAVGRGSDRGVTCYYTISTDRYVKQFRELHPGADDSPTLVRANLLPKSWSPT